MGQYSSGGFEAFLKSGLLGTWKRRAQPLAQSGRCPRQPQRSFRFQLRRCGTGKTFQQASDPALVPQLLEDMNAFAIECLRGGVVHQFAGQISQVGQ